MGSFDYQIEKSVYDRASDKATLSNVFIDFQNTSRDERVANSTTRLAKQLYFEDAVLNWKTDCPHPPTGSAKYQFFLPSQPDKPLTGEVKSSPEGVVMPTNSSVKPLTWSEKCKMGANNLKALINSPAENLTTPQGDDTSKN
jgi:hypothetical protein